MSRDDVVYQHSGTVCSFPYDFIIYKDGDGLKGEVTDHIYTNVKAEREALSALQKKVSEVEAQKDSCFYLENGDVNYRSVSVVDDSLDGYDDWEIDIRRHFIEDYLEAEDTLRELVKPYGAKTLKTEFVRE